MTAFFKASKTANYYVYVNSGAVESVTVSNAMNTFVRNIGDEEFIIDIGKCTKDDVFSLYLPINEDSTADGITMYVYYIDNDKFEQGYEYLSSGALDIKQFDDTHISGTIDVNDNFIFTSIPYDQGWSVEIDGKAVEKKDIIIVGDALLGVKAENGEHSISFKYTPRGLKEGIAISCGMLILLLILLYVSIKLRLFDSYYVSFERNNDPLLSLKKDDLIQQQRAFIIEQQNAENLIVKPDDFSGTDENIL